MEKKDEKIIKDLEAIVASTNSPEEAFKKIAAAYPSVSVEELKKNYEEEKKKAEAEFSKCSKSEDVENLSDDALEEIAGGSFGGWVKKNWPYLVLGANILTAAAQNIRRGNFFDENTLMTIATLGAFAIGEYAEAVGVVLFFRIGEMFEDFAVARSRKAITAAAALRVEEAEILRDGAFTVIDADEIEAGDLLRIKTGERIAADGIVESGESRIDTSAVNGEPVPMTVRPGDRVLSGCIKVRFCR